MSEENELSISADLEAWKGYTTQQRPMVPLFESDVRRYADATGDAHPLWLDDEFARRQGHRGRVLPQILVGWTLFSTQEQGGSTQDQGGENGNLRTRLPLPPEYTHFRNVSNETEWARMVHLGEKLRSRDRIVDISAHRTRHGVGIFITQEREIVDQAGEVVNRRASTVVALAEAAASVDDGER